MLIVLVYLVPYKEVKMKGPSKDAIHPLPYFPEIIFLKNIADNTNIIVGDYTCCNDPK